MTTSFRRILVPHDFSEPADAALELAADLAASQGGRLVVLHVVEPFHPPPEIVAWLREAQEIGPQLKRLEEVVAARMSCIARARHAPSARAGRTCLPCNARSASW